MAAVQTTAEAGPAPSEARRGEPLLIRPQTGWTGVDLHELWRYRELLYFFTWRDVKVRYKQTLLGAAWAVLQPALMMLVFWVFFARLAKVPHENVPYIVFAYAGLLPWLLFSNGMQFSASSLVSNSQLLTKVYFPRLLVAVSPCLAALVDFVLALGLLVVLMVVYGTYPQPVGWLLIFPLTALAVIAAAGFGSWLAALNVRYRDVRYVIPFLSQLWLFATPVIYPATLVHEPWRTIYGLNPLVGIVEGFRWAVVGSGPGPGAELAVSAAVSVAALVAGVLYFQRTEERIADVV